MAAALHERRHRRRPLSKQTNSTIPWPQARSKPMAAICKRLLAFGEFELVIFGDDVITEQPVDEWPLCDALLSWHSEGFPLKKVMVKFCLPLRPQCSSDKQPCPRSCRSRADRAVVLAL